MRSRRRRLFWSGRRRNSRAGKRRRKNWCACCSTQTNSYTWIETHETKITERTTSHGRQRLRGDCACRNDGVREVAGGEHGESACSEIAAREGSSEGGDSSIHAWRSEPC